MIPLLTHLPPPRVARQIRLDRFSPNFEQGMELGFTLIEPYDAYHYIYPLPVEAVRNLAYFFTFGYREPRDVEAYTGPLAREISRWQRVNQESRLVYFDSGEELWIWDLRPCARKELTILSGLQRAIYLGCDGIVTLGNLARTISPPGERQFSAGDIEEMLRPLVEQGLVLHDRDRVLSLAIPKNPRSPEQAADTMSAGLRAATKVQPEPFVILWR